MIADKEKSTHLGHKNPFRLENVIGSGIECVDLWKWEFGYVRTDVFHGRDFGESLE